MNVQYKNLSDKIITTQQAECEGLHNKEYLENGKVKIIEKKLFSEIQWITYYKDSTENNEEIFNKYKNILSITAIFIKTRDYQIRPPYIVETKETFWKDGEQFVDQLITTKDLIDPSGRIVHGKDSIVNYLQQIQNIEELERYFILVIKMMII